jgi:type II secretion system protein C
MQKLSNKKIISIVTTLLGLVLFAKLIALTLWWYLPNEGVTLSAQEPYPVAYQRVDFKNMLPKYKATNTKNQEEKSAFSINNMVLKGLYGSGSYGYAIVAPKSTPSSTEIIAVGEVYKGYKLQTIEFDKVTFSKNNKKYVLYLEVSKIDNYENMVTKVSKPSSDEPKLIEKKDIKYYSKNPNMFWKEIGIDEHMVDGKLSGFTITRLKKGSKLELLGLKKGDLLIKVNNMELNSLKTVVKLYEKLDTLKEINLVFLRNNQEMEINYEIN